MRQSTLPASEAKEQRTVRTISASLDNDKESLNRVISILRRLGVDLLWLSFAGAHLTFSIECTEGAVARTANLIERLVDVSECKVL